MSSRIFIPELLQKIISYHKESPKIIFKCSLVSKSWCDTAIPFLWKNPFRFCYSAYQHKIIKVYLQFLSKEFLKEYDLNQIAMGLDYEKKSFSTTSTTSTSTTTSTSSSSTTTTTTTTTTTPTYNYLSFLQELVYITLYESLISLLKKHDQEYQNERNCPNLHPSKQFMINKVLPIMNELCKLFINNGTRIKHFHLSAPFVDCNCKWLPLNYITIPSSSPQSSSSKSLSSIRSLICDNKGYDFNDIIMELSKHSKNITMIEIKRPRNDENLLKWINLINSQKFLQKLKLEFFTGQGSSKIVLSIPSQYQSLREVELVYCKFFQTILLDELSKCPNLTTLKIKDCTFSNNMNDINNDDINNDIDNNDDDDDNNYNSNYNNDNENCSNYLDYFKNSQIQIINYFPTLKSLHVSKSHLSQEYFLSFIGNPSKLEKITLNLIDFFKYPKIIPFIYLNCFQLKILEIVLVEETFGRIIPIIENCKSLEEISIWEKYDWIGHEFYDYHDSYIDNYMNSNQVIKEISKRLPEINLKKFYFPQIFNFNLQEIQYFIQNSPDTLRDLRFYAIVNDKNDVINLLKNFAIRTGNRKSIIKHSESRINYDFDKTTHHIFVE